MSTRPSTESSGAPPRSPRPLDLDLEDEGVATPALVHRATAALLLLVHLVGTVAHWVFAPTAAGEVLVGAELVVAVIAALDWWCLKRHGIRSRAFFVAPLIYALIAAIVMWLDDPGLYVWALAAMGVLFIRLPLSWAIACAVCLLGVAVSAHVLHGPMPPRTVIRVAFSGSFFIALLALARHTFDGLVVRLRKMTRLLRDTIESTGQGIAVLDPNGWVVLHNRRALDILALPPEWLDGRPLNASDIARMQAARGDVQDISDPRVRDLIASGVSLVDEQMPTRYLRRWGVDRWLEIAMERMPSGHIVRSFVDVTEHVESRRVAERIAEARTAFLSSLSHECRTPMNAVLGVARLVLQDEPEGERRESLLTLEAAAQQLQQQLGDIVDLAALESGAESIKQEPFSLPELVARAVALSRLRVASRGIDVQAELSPDLAEPLVGDGPRIERLLMTLLRQAEQTTERGRIQVRVEGEGAVSGQQQWRITVHDTGHGLTPTAAEPLRRLPDNGNLRDPIFDGAVGGLAIVRRYVELMGGKVGVRTEYGKGTTVWVTLGLPPTAVHASSTVRQDAGVPASIGSSDVGVSLPTPVQVNGDESTTFDRADADASIPSADRVRMLSAEIADRWHALNALPYRTWVIACVVTAVTFLSLAVVQGGAALTSPTSISNSAMLWPLPLSLLAAFMALRHRRLDRAYGRDSKLQLVVVVVLFAIGIRLNGLLPLAVLPTAIISLYLVHSPKVARAASMVLLVVSALLLGDEQLQLPMYFRLIAAAVGSMVMMEWLLRNLAGLKGTLEKADADLGSLSLTLAGENAKLEEAARQSDRTVKHRAALIGTISHEIRTPLHAVLGLSRLVSDEPLNPRQKEWMERIRDNGQHLLHLVTEILDASRIESGAVRLLQEPLDLEGVMGQVSDVLRREGLTKGLRTLIDVSPDVPRHYVGDRTRLTQILLNLVSNAVKYTEHGEIALRVDRLTATGDGVSLRFTVRDTGIGLSPKQQARLFQPFEQLESAAFAYDGAGLGLSICKAIADSMGGRLSVTSTRGTGSTCALDVSWTPADAALARPAAMLTPGQEEHVRGARILVVDDHRVNRDVTGELLRRRGAVVYLAEDGEAAVTAVRRWKPDLVLMDVQMPILDGLEATRQLRQIDEFRDLPIIALTAAALTGDEARCREAGMNDILTKPVELETLEQMVSKWLPDTVRESAEHDARGVTRDERTIVESVELLHDVYGLDAVGGLRRMANDRALYLTLLGSALKRHDDDMNLIARALADDQLEEARRITHLLNGVSGTLGATKVHGAARALEALMHDGESGEVMMAALGRLREEFEPFVGSLRRVLERESAAREARPVSATDGSRSPMDTFLALLSASNADALNMLRGRRDLLSTLNESDRTIITELTESLDLRAAAAHLREALARVA